MGGICSTYWKDEKCLKDTATENVKGRKCRRVVGVDKLTLRWILNTF
jgi:hypothetical protein